MTPRPLIARLSNMLSTVEIHDLGNRIQCPYCSALEWIQERVQNSRVDTPIFNVCCGRGRLSILPVYPDLPPEFVSIMNSTHVVSTNFRSKIRAFNSILSFGSVMADEQAIAHSSQGVFTYSVSGNIHHRISDIPNPHENARFGGIYFFEPVLQASIGASFMPNLNRLHHIL